MSRHDREQNILSTDDPVRNLIAKKASELGETLASLSKKLKRNHAYLQQFVKRKIPKRLPENVRHQLTYFLQVDESQLRVGLQMKKFADRSEGASYTLYNSVTTTVFRQIPTYGHATGGPRGEFKLSKDNLTGDIPAPPMLVNVRDAYAIYMVGNTMKPRYYAGETIYVHPGLPVRDGDYIVLQFADNNASDGDDRVLAMVCQQLSKTTFAQINPYKELELADDQIVARHRIVLAG
jgi:phage repressor protein C with HTH and peptisase S24 domain